MRAANLFERARVRSSCTGLVIAAFVSITIANLATPLFGMACMVHMHKPLADKAANRA